MLNNFDLFVSQALIYSVSSISNQNPLPLCHQGEEIARELAPDGKRAKRNNPNKEINKQTNKSSGWKK
jgi:hypothetical protein